LKTQKNEENTTLVYQINYICFHVEFPHKMRSDVKECIPIHSFELNLTALPIDKFQLTEKHDQAQNNILEVHSFSSHSSYTREFDVKTYIVDLIKYMLCSLHSFDFSKSLANFYAKYKILQYQHSQQTSMN
jgi:hypothetical protein